MELIKGLNVEKEMEAMEKSRPCYIHLGSYKGTK
jgi:hypothetical protein